MGSRARSSHSSEAEKLWNILSRKATLVTHEIEVFNHAWSASLHLKLPVEKRTFSFLSLKRPPEETTGCVWVACKRENQPGMCSLLIFSIMATTVSSVDLKRSKSQSNTLKKTGAGEKRKHSNASISARNGGNLPTLLDDVVPWYYPIKLYQILTLIHDLVAR